MLLVASGGRIGEMQGGGGHTRRYGRRRGPRRGEQSRSRSWVTRGRAMHRSVPPRRPGGRTRRCAFAMRVDRSDGTWPPVRAGRNAHDDARPTSLARGGNGWRHWIVPSTVPRVTAPEPAKPEPNPANESESLDCRYGIDAAGGG